MKPQNGLDNYSQIPSKHLPQCKRLTQRHVKLVSSQLFYAYIGESNNRLTPINKGKDRIYIVERGEKRRKIQIFENDVVTFLSFFLFYQERCFLAGNQLRDQSQCLLTRDYPEYMCWPPIALPNPVFPQIHAHSVKKPHSFIQLAPASKDSLHHEEFW